MLRCTYRRRIRSCWMPGGSGRAIGTWSGFTTLTAALGPVLGGWLVQAVSWRAVFFINLPLAALVLLIALWRVPESRDEQATGELDWPGGALTTLGLGGVVYGLIEWGPSAWDSRLQEVQGYSAAAAGASLLPFTALLFGLSRWSGGLVDRCGARRPLTLGPAIAAGGFALFALPGIGGSYWSTYFPAVIVLGLGMSITVAPLTTAVMGAVDQRHSGIASGVNNAVSRAAGLLALAALGIVVAAIFSSGLDSRLDGLRVAPAVRHSLDAQRTRLAAAQLPAGLPPAERAALQQAIGASFLAGFRAEMLAGAGLAALSALVAAALIEDTAPESTTAEQQSPALGGAERYAG